MITDFYFTHRTKIIVAVSAVVAAILIALFFYPPLRLVGELVAKVGAGVMFFGLATYLVYTLISLFMPTGEPRKKKEDNE